MFLVRGNADDGAASFATMTGVASVDFGTSTSGFEVSIF